MEITRNVGSYTYKDIHAERFTTAKVIKQHKYSENGFKEIPMKEH